MKVFLSYDFKDDISKITNLLNEQGVDIFDSRNDVEYGNSFQKAIKNAILECDFLFLIYSSENPNIAFEAGIAVSSNKPIFSVISERKNEPDFLFDSTYVHATPSEIDKIKFNLKIFLEKLKPKKNINKTWKHKFHSGVKPNYYIEFHNKYSNLINKNEKSYELLFKEIFERYQLNVIQNKFDSKANFYADFCIWSDKLNNVIGNPILIEIKKEINAKNILQLKDTLNSLTFKNSTESCIVFYDYLNGVNKSNLPNTSKYLFIEISDFIEKLNEGDFNDSIRKIRNEIIYNQK